MHFAVEHEEELEEKGEDSNTEHSDTDSRTDK